MCIVHCETYDDSIRNTITHYTGCYWSRRSSKAAGNDSAHERKMLQLPFCFSEIGVIYARCRMSNFLAKCLWMSNGAAYILSTYHAGRVLKCVIIEWWRLFHCAREIAWRHAVGLKRVHITLANISVGCSSKAAGISAREKNAAAQPVFFKRYKKSKMYCWNVCEWIAWMIVIQCSAFQVRIM